MADRPSNLHPYPVSALAPAEEPPAVPAVRPPPKSLLRQLEASYAKERLNLAPTLALCVPMFFVFLSLAAFLEVYVLSTASSFLGIFFVGSYIVFSSYFVADHYMALASTSYAKIEEGKKFYVLSNLIKSAVLLAYTPSAAATLYKACVNDDWSTPRIRALGVLYAIPDAVSMLLVRRMATSTKVHHLCVVFFMCINLVVTYEQKTVGRALVVYGVFSTFAYLVNLLLASRFLPVSPASSLVLSCLAFGIYPASLAINWTWQCTFLYDLVIFERTSAAHGACIALYLALISMVVYDDCVLVRWLWKNVDKRVETLREASGGCNSPKRAHHNPGHAADSGKKVI